jgi:hypothetical protein
MTENLILKVYLNKMKNKKYQTIGTKSYTKIVERYQIDTPNY